MKLKITIVITGIIICLSFCMNQSFAENRPFSPNNQGVILQAADETSRHATLNTENTLAHPDNTSKDNEQNTEPSSFMLAAEDSPQTDPALEAEEEAELKAMDAYFNKFKVSITPYWFFLGITADVGIGDRVSNTVVSPDQVNSMMNTGFNTRIDLNKAHWGAFFDTSNLVFNKSQSVTRLKSDFNMQSIINQYCVYYRCTGVPIVDIYAGARSFTFNTDLILNLAPFPSRSIPGNDTWTDTILGVRLTKPFSENLALTVGADTGVFAGSNGSTSLYAMLGWTINPSIAINGGYEIMKFTRTKTASVNDAFTMNATMSGPVVSIGFNF